ncbi:WxcM-like protein [Melghirimyces profundicolus]|uniref:WxcM-like protein n=1 Tax=Melghirimyces profundicolus TaxID=1242148 RepID=A0A2T6B247_9BACL|nr:FdtA/QdtA family cupin domain-containing protein [Melghirimyces profundicolus]PTX50134.1 WxcM-like protein [Melghirimyces profundicolus]
MNIRLLDFDVKEDERGSLIALEGTKEIPFEIRRIYYIFGASDQVRRGDHAHKELQQILIALAGSCTVSVTDGCTKEEIPLPSRTQGLFIGRMVWRELHDFSPDCVLLVLASDYYNKNDYISSYEDFLKMVEKRGDHHQQTCCDPNGSDR